MMAVSSAGVPVADAAADRPAVGEGAAEAMGVSEVLTVKPLMVERDDVE